MSLPGCDTNLQAWVSLCTWKYSRKKFLLKWILFCRQLCLSESTDWIHIILELILSWTHLQCEACLGDFESCPCDWHSLYWFCVKFSRAKTKIKYQSLYPHCSFDCISTPNPLHESIWNLAMTGNVILTLSLCINLEEGGVLFSIISMVSNYQCSY